MINSESLKFLSLGSVDIIQNKINLWDRVDINPKFKLEIYNFGQYIVFRRN